MTIKMEKAYKGNSISASGPGVLRFEVDAWIHGEDESNTVQ
jgi:hypothetical protein